MTTGLALALVAWTMSYRSKDPLPKAEKDQPND